MPDHTAVPFDALPSADLVVGKVYRGGPQKDIGADPLHPLTGVGNAGGYRRKNVKGTRRAALCVLYSTGQVSEWPDGWQDDGTYLYYGDQRTPGLDVLETPRGGNKLLADVATTLRQRSGRSGVPPLLLFTKAAAESGRDVRFEGLVVPAGASDWLAIEHRKRADGVLSNYSARLMPLPVDVIERHWLNQIVDGVPDGSAAPVAWRRWLAGG